MSEQFKYLFSPLRVGSIEVRNRIVSLPHGMGFTEGGRPIEQQLYYLAERAKGGVGLIIFSAHAVHPTTEIWGLFHSYKKKFIPDYRAIADAVHQHGAKIIVQLFHGGRSFPSFFTQLPVWAFSAVPCPVGREMPHEMDESEIKELVDAFTNSAINMETAGYDGIELHSAHGYLLQQSMSPWSNQRSDQYGGSFDNRLRFITEVIDSIRAEVSPQFVLGVRISGDEMKDGGLSLEDMCEIASRLEATGKVDYISVAFATISRYVLDMSSPLAPIAYMAARIRENVDIPVITSQRINDPLLAEKILAEGQADLIGMARALICDPELPNKAKEGRLDDIRTCVACLQECRRSGKVGTNGCMQNPAVGKEKDLGIGSLRLASKRKRITVVGGGPAGMEAARIAAMRGHDVTLYEQKSELGGQVNIAALAPNRDGIKDVVRYQINQINKLGVKVNLGSKVDAQAIREEAPDAVVIATGSIPLLPSLGDKHCMQVVSVWDILENKVDPGKKSVVVDGGESFWQCCSTAEFILQKNRKVEIVSYLPYIGVEIPTESFAGLMERLTRGGAVLNPSMNLERAEGSTLICSHVFSGEEKRITDVDTVIMAVGNLACNELYKTLKGEIEDLYEVGDCVAPRKIPDAIREGDAVGRTL